MITRAAAKTEALAKAIRERGAVPIEWPLIEFSAPEDLGPLDNAIARIQQFDWLIFTSGEAVREVHRRCKELGQSLAQAGSNLSIAAVGPVTAGEVRKIGLQVSYVAQKHSGVALANELGSKLQGSSVLLPRSDRANPDLPAALKRYGAQVTEVVAYRTVKAKGMDQEKLRECINRQVDAILFFSPSAVQHFAELVGGEQFRRIQDMLAMTAVGPVTANALREAEIQRTVVATDTTAASVIEALEKHFAAKTKVVPAGAKRG